MKNIIDPDSIVFPMIPSDLVGRIFFYNGKVLRAIYKESCDHITNLLNSGLISELVEQKLFPKTEIANYYLSEKYPMIIEHEKIQTLSLPYEWSFEMLKDAAIATIKVNNISNKYGYKIHDCHASNIMFKDNRPMFVDLGSFVKSGVGDYGIDSKIFDAQFTIPLRYWAKGYKDIARSSFLFRNYINEKEYFRLLNVPFKPGFMSNYSYILDRIRGVSEARIEQKVSNKFLVFFLLRLKKCLLNFYSGKDHLKEISKINYKHKKTKWSNYHDTTIIDGEYRFERIVELINGFNDANSVLELASNQGKFAKYILKNTHLTYVIASDYDDIAVDSMYKSSKNQKGFQSLLFDFVRPDGRICDEEISDRVKSDIVVALAVTHHLLLSQGIKLEYLIDRLEKFTKKFLLVEFMPKGLGDATKLPDFYSVDWFRSALKSKFNILHEEKLADNRYLFVAKKEKNNLIR